MFISRLYDRFRCSQNAARDIEEIRIKLKLKHRFNEINDLLNIHTDQFNQWTIEKMDASMKKTIEILDRINEEEKLKCLRAFTESLNLVEWLRLEAKSLSELKVLVDMASMSSAGDTQNGAQTFDMTIFAKTLKEAGSAFASLIYELKVDDGFYQFMNLCEKVCSHLQTDPKIADKLKAVKDKVPLLEEIKKRRGQVESNALNEAKQLNEYGVYNIGLSTSLKSVNLLSSLDLQKEIKISDLITLEIETKTKNGIFFAICDILAVLFFKDHIYPNNSIGNIPIIYFYRVISPRVYIRN